MASETAERFMKALQQTEAARDPGPVSDLFGDDAELTTLAHPDPRRGRDGAKQFWAEYLHAFGQIRSQFGDVHEAGPVAVLEWSSDGELPDGSPVHYRGVSILETADGRVRKFRTYYDSAALRINPKNGAKVEIPNGRPGEPGNEPVPEAGA